MADVIVIVAKQVAHATVSSKGVATANIPVAIEVRGEEGIAPLEAVAKVSIPKTKLAPLVAEVSPPAEAESEDS